MLIIKKRIKEGLFDCTMNDTEVKLTGEDLFEFVQEHGYEEVELLSTTVAEFPIFLIIEPHELEYAITTLILTNYDCVYDTVDLVGTIEEAHDLVSDFKTEMDIDHVEITL